MMETPWIALNALLGLLLAFWLMLAGQGIRRRRGLGSGRTISLDRITLTSVRLGLTGRPDRLYRSGGVIIIEEWKSAKSLKPWHEAQMGVYFLLAEERLGERPSHGFLVTGDDKRHRIDNTDALREWVLGMAEAMRQRRMVIDQPMAVHTAAWQCRACGMLRNCSQARV